MRFTKTSLSVRTAQWRALVLYGVIALTVPQTAAGDPDIVTITAEDYSSLYEWANARDSGDLLRVEEADFIRIINPDTVAPFAEAN